MIVTEESKQIYLKIASVIKDRLEEYGITPDAEADSLSIYYKLPPEGILYNSIRIATHAPTVRRMFGNEKSIFPSTDEDGNNTIYIYIEQIVNAKIEHIQVPDYEYEKDRETTMKARRFDRIQSYYPKDSEGNLTFSYKIHIFDSKKFIDDNNEINNPDALNAIGDSSYKWYTAFGKYPFIIPDAAKSAFIKTVDCTGIIRKASVNEFKNTSRQLEFLIGYLKLDNGEKLEVILRVKDLPSILFNDFIIHYGHPVSNNFISRKTVEVDTASIEASELLKKYFIDAGFPEGDIAVRQNENGIMLDIRNKTSLMIFIWLMSQKEHISYIEVRKKYGV